MLPGLIFKEDSGLRRPKVNPLVVCKNVYLIFLKFILNKDKLHFQLKSQILKSSMLIKLKKRRIRHLTKN